MFRLCVLFLIVIVRGAIEISQGNHLNIDVFEDGIQCDKNFITKKLQSESNNDDVNLDILAMWKKFPLTIMENTTRLSEKCKIAYDRFLDGVSKRNFNDIKMLDATGKLSSGLLSGNVNQFGDFDECMELENGQYCLADVDVKHLMTGLLEPYRDLIHSYFPISETFDDPTHRTPGFSMVRWGFCIPKECTSNDLEFSLEEKLDVKVKIRENMCQFTHKVEDKSNARKFARWYFTIIISLVLFTSIFHNVIQNSKNTLLRLLHCFSIQRNYNNLTTIKEDDKKDIKSIHGLRSLCAIALLGTHKSMALLFNPYINRTKMAENIGQGWSVIGRNAIVYTECFFVISGLLNANALFSDLQKFNSLKFKDKIINRIIRILPNLVSIILFYTYILPEWGSGPQWPLVVGHHSDLCKKYMWRNFFFVHNWFGFRNMCLTHTHQIGIDMQLFLATPIFVLLLWKYRKMGVWFTIGSILASSVLRFWVVYRNNLSYYVYFGIPVSQLFNVADLSYILPTHRATTYLWGVLLSYWLKTTNPNPIFTKSQVVLYWGIFFAVIGIDWIGPYYMSFKTFTYDNLEAGLYAALSPLTWGAVTILALYLAIKDYGGWIAVVFEWKYWEYFSKIAYSLYLVQFPVYFYNVGKRRHTDEYSPSMIFHLPEVLTIVMWSIILTLFVEFPFQNIKKVLYSEDKPLAKSTTGEEINTATEKNNVTTTTTANAATRRSAKA